MPQLDLIKYAVVFVQKFQKLCFRDKTGLETRSELPKLVYVMNNGTYIKRQFSYFRRNHRMKTWKACVWYVIIYCGGLIPHGHAIIHLHEILMFSHWVNRSIKREILFWTNYVSQNCIYYIKITSVCWHEDIILQVL